MEIIRDSIDFKIVEKTALTIGKFDGVHRGHQMILDRLREYRINGLKTCVMTFDIPPSMMGYGNDKQVIMSLREKEMVFEAYGIDYLVELPFYEKTASIRANQFIEEFVVDRLNAGAVVVGSDCTFGYRAEGNAQMLRDFGPIFGYNAEILNKLMDGDREISSTYLRELLRAGEVAKVASLSYRAYFDSGRVKQGQSSICSSLLTYYFEVPKEKVMPKPGVYYTKIFFEEALYPALTHVPEEGRVMENYVYGGIRSISRDEVSIVFLERLRDTIRFEKRSDANKQVREDIFKGEKWHKENSSEALLEDYTVKA